MRSFLREPLVHFLILGAAIFGLFAAFNDVAPQASDRLEVTTSDVERLSRQFQATWQRPPKEDEISVLVQSYVNQELLVREALALGMDRGDPLIRQRLEQKMVFLIEGQAASAEPSESELEAFLQSNPDRYRRSATVSFEQLLLASQEPTQIDEILATLNAGDVSETQIANSLLPSGAQGAQPSVVDGMFGTGFFDALLPLEIGVWQGPVRSGYGWHVVRVTGRNPAELPDLEEVRVQVLDDWRRKQTEQQLAKTLDVLRAETEIVIGVEN